MTYAELVRQNAKEMEMRLDSQGRYRQDAPNDGDVEWITVNGARIPLKDGKAVGGPKAVRDKINSGSKSEASKNAPSAATANFIKHLEKQKAKSEAAAEKWKGVNEAKYNKAMNEIKSIEAKISSAQESEKQPSKAGTGGQSNTSTAKNPKSASNSSKTGSKDTPDKIKKYEKASADFQLASRDVLDLTKRVGMYEHHAKYGAPDGTPKSVSAKKLTELKGKLKDAKARQAAARTEMESNKPSNDYFRKATFAH